MSLKFISTSARLHHWHCTWISERHPKFYMSKTRIMIFSFHTWSSCRAAHLCDGYHWPPSHTRQRLGSHPDPILFIHHISLIPHFCLFCFLNISPSICFSSFLLILSQSSFLSLCSFNLLAIASLGSSVHSGLPLIHHPYCSKAFEMVGEALRLSGPEPYLPHPAQPSRKQTHSGPWGSPSWWPFELLLNLWGLPLPNSIYANAFALLECSQAHSCGYSWLLLQAQDEDSRVAAWS